MNPDELITYGQDSVKVKRPEAPNLRIHIKSGTFTLSITAKELIGVNDGDQVMVGQDPLNKQQWYIWKVDKAGLKIKKANYSGKVNAVIFRNASLAQNLVNSVEFYGAAGTLKIGKEPIVFESKPGVRFWELITSSLK